MGRGGRNDHPAVRSTSIPGRRAGFGLPEIATASSALSWPMVTGLQPHNRHGVEPHTAWRYSEPQSKKLKTVVYMPRLHIPGRSVWRGIGALLPSISGRGKASGGGPQPFLAPGVSAVDQ